MDVDEQLVMIATARDMSLTMSSRGRYNPGPDSKCADDVNKRLLDVVNDWRGAVATRVLLGAGGQGCVLTSSSGGWPSSTGFLPVSPPETRDRTMRRIRLRKEERGEKDGEWPQCLTLFLANSVAGRTDEREYG